MDHKESVQAQFGNSAEAYVESPLHKKGKDLDLLVQLAELTGKETVLDVATGGGHTAHAMAPFAFGVIAFDLTARMLEVARKFISSNGYQNVQFVQGDAERMPFEANSFDVVTCRIAAHHFPKINSFISEVYRVLKPNGIFLLDDNVAPELDEWDLFYNKVEKWRDPSHHRALKKTEWFRQIEIQGFEVIESHGFRKTFQFEPWFDRMKQPLEEKEQLKSYILNASAETKKKFRVAEDQGQLQSFEGEALLLKARKF